MNSTIIKKEETTTFRIQERIFIITITSASALKSVKSDDWPVKPNEDCVKYEHGDQVKTGQQSFGIN